MKQQYPFFLENHIEKQSKNVFKNLKSITLYILMTFIKSNYYKL